MLNIEIKTISHKDQPYNTVGEYHYEDEKEIIVVSDLDNWKYEALVAIHEVSESILCKARGIEIRAIVDFDKRFDKEHRTVEKPTEPGTSPEAPYHKEHTFATFVEKELAEVLGVDWDEYNKYIDNLYSKSIKEKWFK